MQFVSQKLEEEFEEKFSSRGVSHQNRLPRLQHFKRLPQGGGIEGHQCFSIVTGLTDCFPKRLNLDKLLSYESCCVYVGFAWISVALSG
jgi:hypothetical protein